MTPPSWTPAAGSTLARQPPEDGQVVADRAYVNTDTDVILARMLAARQRHRRKWDDPDYMKFYNEGTGHYPLSLRRHVVLTQHRRWGPAQGRPGLSAVAKKVNRIDVTNRPPRLAKVPLPKSDFAPRN